MLIFDEFVQEDKSDAVVLSCFVYFQKLTLLYPQKSLIKRSGELISDLLDNDL